MHRQQQRAGERCTPTGIKTQLQAACLKLPEAHLQPLCTSTVCAIRQCALHQHTTLISSGTDTCRPSAMPFAAGAVFSAATSHMCIAPLQRSIGSHCHRPQYQLAEPPTCSWGGAVLPVPADCMLACKAPSSVQSSALGGDGFTTSIAGNVGHKSHHWQQCHYPAAQKGQAHH